MGQAGSAAQKRISGIPSPVDAPLYEPFPMHYEEVSIPMFPYVTDAAAALKLLPSQFELAPVHGDSSGKLAGAVMVFANYGFSTVGAYNEVAQTVACIYKGSETAFRDKLVSYAVRLHVDNDMAMTAGREIGGFPKKLGNISFTDTPIYVSALESPEDLLICSGELQAFAKVGEQRLFPPPCRHQVLPFVSIRIIPDPASLKLRRSTRPLPADLHRMGSPARHVLECTWPVAMTGASSAQPVSRASCHRTGGAHDAAEPAGHGAVSRAHVDRSGPHLGELLTHERTVGIAHYRLEGLLGRGGMGEVYRALRHPPRSGGRDQVARRAARRTPRHDPALHARNARRLEPEPPAHRRGT